MTRITPTCPRCNRETKLHPSDARLVTCRHSLRLTWRCSSCGEHVDLDLTPHTAKMMVDAGVPVVPIEDASGLPPLTEDDLIAFGLELEASG